MKTVLITGFGPFPGVAENPSAALARAVDGRVVDGVRFVGEVLPVSYRRAPDQTVALRDAHKADVVLGTGVCRDEVARLETVAHHVLESRVDIEGQTLTLLAGPAQVPATFAGADLADRLGVARSDDAGRYVCNAWLYQVAQRAGVPVGFLHIPASGFDADRLVQAVAAGLA